MTPRLLNAASAALLALGLLAAGIPPDLHAQTQPDIDVVRRAIDGGNAKYIAAMADMNADAFAAVYDRAGSRLNEGGRVLRGQQEIAYAMRQYFRRTGRVQVILETLDVWVIDDLAYETGNWRHKWTPQDQAEVRTGGKYVTIWRKQPDSGWRIWADLGVPGTEERR